MCKNGQEIEITGNKFHEFLPSSTKTSNLCMCMTFTILALSQWSEWAYAHYTHIIYIERFLFSVFPSLAFSIPSNIDAWKSGAVTLTDLAGVYGEWFYLLYIYICWLHFCRWNGTKSKHQIMYEHILLQFSICHVIKMSLFSSLLCIYI